MDSSASAALLNYETALGLTLASVPESRYVSVPLEEAAGFVMAADLQADTPLPPFNKSFMDGYALRSEDLGTLPAGLRVIGVQPAGKPKGLVVTPGTTVQIMTGAQVPEGADAVQMVEKTRSLDEGRVEILVAVESGSHIAPLGSETEIGDTVLESGRQIGAAEVAVLATFGQHAVEIVRPPTVAIVATGDELVPVDTTPGPGKIRNSNAPMLAAQCRKLGLKPELLSPVADHPDAVFRALEETQGFDLVIFTGGVSAGEFDYVHRMFPRFGLEQVFHKAAVKPGKPILVASDGHRMVFGLPGNPVSSLVTFEIFARPALRKWMGFASDGLQRVQGELQRTVYQKPGRLFFKPATTRWKNAGFVVEPIETKGSADIVAFSRADSLFLMGEEQSSIKKGSPVPVILLEPQGVENHNEADARR